MANQKLENQLNLAVQTPIREREKSLALNIGYEEENNTWELIIRFNGSLQPIREQLGVEIIELLNNYAVVYIEQDLIPRLNEALQKTTAQERLSIVPTTDNTGHGTHVASLERGFVRTTQIMLGLSYLVEKAIEYNKPIAINLSLGNNYGSHDGRAMLETFIDDIAGLWENVICVGAGNEGSASKHTSGVVTTGPVMVQFVIGENEGSEFWDPNKSAYIIWRARSL